MYKKLQQVNFTMFARTVRYNLYKSTLRSPVGSASASGSASYSTLGDKAKQVGDKLDETLQKGKEAFNKATSNANEKAQEAKQTFNEATSETGDKASKKFEETKQAFNKATADANQKAHEAKEHAKDKINDAASEVKKNTQ